ncbi:arylsulfatase [Sciscionella marina]|uniref:arylsulfatase n=1 Tax=Sciscionella marina TaxID=508770 RepID=UPI000363A380|nr:arylsulfatase [Sciscionella marina]
MAGTEFGGHIGRTYRDSVPWWPQLRAPEANSPNVVLLLLDDVGFGSLGCYGSEIATPNIDRLAGRGLRYTNFHTTALCSPTRASLLTGRNHHSVGMSIIANADSGFPSKRGAVSHNAGTIAEMLRGEGYATFAIGKWHIAPADQTSTAGPFDQWPLGRGFDRFYGFLDAATDQFHPELTYDNHRVDPPAKPEDGYHLTADLVDHANSFVTDQVSLAPDKPFLLYFATGAMHSPHQAPENYLAKYRGAYDHGWDAVREARLARQKELGIVTPDTELAPRNPGVPAWGELPGERQRLYARFQEAYAAFLEHTDHELGRFLDHLERLGQLDNTVFVLLSDNGASQEGQHHGSVNMATYENEEIDSVEYNQRYFEDIGTWRVQNNYPLGWAMTENTPLKRYKQNTHAGGVRDPLIISWPDGISARGAVRNQFHHVVDIVPTVLEVLGMRAPETVDGVPQMPIHGTGMRYSFESDGPSRKQVQYFEMFGSRALWQDGWKAVAYHAADTRYEDDVWELYHLDSDFSECHDLAARHPERLRAMIEEWWAQAGRYDVLPLDDRRFAARRAAASARPDAVRSRNHITLWGGCSHVPNGATPFILDRSYTLTAHVECGPEDEGVLIACGSVGGGYSFYIKDSRIHHDYNYYGGIYRVSAPVELTTGPHTFTYTFRKTGALAGVGRILSGDRVLAEVEMPETSRYFMSWGGLDLGRDGCSPVSQAYSGEFPFTGTIDRVVFDLEDDTEQVGDYEPQD